MKKLIIVFLIILFTGCTQVVTAPIRLAGTVVDTTFDVVGAAGGAIVNTVSGGNSDEDD